MELAQLKGELDVGKVRPVYVFAGSEKEIMLEYAKRISPDYVKTDNFIGIIPHLVSTGLFAKNPPLFVVDGDNALTDIDPADIAKTVGNNRVIFIVSSVDMRARFFKHFSDSIVNFEKFDEQTLVRYIKRHLDISDELSFVISRYCGGNVSRLRNEIDKLKQLGQPITLEVVNEIIHPDPENHIFEFVDSVACRGNDAFDLYEDLKMVGEADLKLLSLLYTKFKSLYLVQSQPEKSAEDIAEKTGLNPYGLKKTREMKRAFSNTELVDIVKLLNTVERMMKTGLIEQAHFIPYVLFRIYRTT